MKRISRRRFVILLTGGGITLGASCRRTDTISLELRSVLANDASTELVGGQYLKKVPGEADPDLLRELILSDLPWSASIGTDTPTLVRELVRRDFTEDRTIRLGQWLLSRTEARLCALTALVHQTSS